jgi:hypothetical protein
MCALCCQFLWIVHVRYSLTCILRHVCLMLVVSLDHGQSRETGNIRHTGRRIHVREYRTWTIQRNWQHKAHMTKNTRQRIPNMDNPEKLVLCALCCQFLWIVHVRYSLTCILRHVCLMLPVSLDCPCSVFSNVYSSSCVPYVATFSGLSMFGIL